MKGILRLCRLYYCVPMSLTYLLTLYYACGGQMDWVGAGVSAVALLFVIAGGYVINDVFDVEVDRNNASNRPIPLGQVSRKAALWSGAVLLQTGVVVGLFAETRFAVSLTVVAYALVFYDVYSKRLGTGKPLVVAALMASIYLLAWGQAGGFAGPRADALYLFAGWMFLSSFGYEVLKDIRDIPGDTKASGMRNSLQRHPRMWRWIATGAVVLGAGCLWPAGFLGCKWIYIAIISTTPIAVIASMFLSARRAIVALYVEYVLVGLAAVLDVAILGI